MSPLHEQPAHEVVIVGAGFSGIGAAILLAKAGFDDVMLLEEGDGVGGTWHWNTYPGVAVDIPSFSYQFSFEQRARWSRVYAPGAELKEYAEYCVDRYDLRRRIRCDVKVTAARFDEEANQWQLDTATGEVITARFVIAATGVLTQPRRPDIPGLDNYAGTVMHTARWDHRTELSGKRVAIIGTGASAVQVIPSIAPDVDHLTIFQRTPIWCLPKPDAPLPSATRWMLKTPGARRGLRLASQTFVEATFPLAAHFHRVLPIATGAERLGRVYLRRAVHDPVTRAQLTPAYALGCKRPSFSNDYLPSFNRPNVTLEVDPIARITSHGIRTQSGTEHPCDILILATGFKVFEKGNMPPYPVSGAAERDLEAWWDDHRYQAYHGISVPGFPNYFAILGPYGYNGSSYFNLIETQSRHIIRALTRARRLAATRVEVRPEANDRYLHAMLERRRNQVFYQPSCAQAHSYYFDEHGDVPFRPSPTLETMWHSRSYPLRDYVFSAPRSPAQTTRS